MVLVSKAVSAGAPPLALVVYLVGGIAATVAAWGVWAFWFGGLIWLGGKLTQRQKEAVLVNYKALWRLAFDERRVLAARYIHNRAVAVAQLPAADHRVDHSSHGRWTP